MTLTFSEHAFSEHASNFLDLVKQAIFPVLSKGAFNEPINYHNCNVEILNDDDSTIWVIWGDYNCELKNLPLTALAAVVDTILRSE
jgi:hypothetical protein